MIGLGAIYGIVLQLVAAGVILPIWANAVGLGPLPVSFIVPIGFVTHLVYGVLPGAVFVVVLKDPLSNPERDGWAGHSGWNAGVSFSYME